MSHGMSFDEIDAALSKNVELGYVEIVGVDESGEFVFRMTEKGLGYVEGLAAGRGLSVDDLMRSMGLPVPESGGGE